MFLSLRHCLTGVLLVLCSVFVPLAQAQVDPCYPDYTVTAIIGHSADPHQTGVTLNYGPNASCQGKRTAVFEISNDDQTYVALNAAPYVSNLRQGGDARLQQAIFSVGPAGTYYLRARLDTGDYVGPATVTAN